MDDGPDIPAHVEESVAAIAALHHSHLRKAGPGQRFVSAATAAVARPSTLAVIVLAVIGWMTFNLAEAANGKAAPDPYPFPLLALLVSTGGLLLAAMILIAQRLDDEFATQRNQLTLEVAILAEQKTAKAIALIEELRRADPLVENRRDAVAEALAEPADPTAVLHAIRTAHDKPRDDKPKQPG
jgi:uncharacterized membrane protein